MPTGPSNSRLTAAYIVQLLIPLLLAGGIAALGLWLELSVGLGPIVRTVCLITAFIILALAFPRREEERPPISHLDTPVDPTPHPRLRDALTEAARAARVEPPSRLAISPEPALRVEDDGARLCIGVPTLALLTTEQFRALLAAELAAAGGSTDPFGERLARRAERAAMGWVLKLRAAAYRAIVGTGERGVEQRATAAAARIAPRAALADARGVLTRARASGTDVELRVDLFDDARARASLAEGWRAALAHTPEGFVPLGEGAEALLSGGPGGLAALEAGLTLGDYPLVGWDEVARLGSEQRTWDSVEEILENGEAPTPRSILDEPAFVGQDFEWELTTAARVALHVPASGIDWTPEGDDFVTWADPEGLHEAVAAAMTQGTNTSLTAFITERGGDLDARVPNEPGSDLLAAATGLHPIEGPKINRSVFVDAFVFGDGVLVLPATGGAPFERAQAVARRPRSDTAQAPGARWFPVAEIASVATFDGLQLELRNETVSFDGGTYQDYPAHGKATAVARMLLAAGRDRATVWGAL